MTEYAKLVVAVDSTSAKSASGDLNTLTESGKKAEGGMAGLKAGAVAAAAAIAAAAVAAGAMAKASIDAADSAGEAAAAAGITVEQYTRLGYAMKFSVGGADALDGSMKFLNKSMFDAANGSAQASMAFDRLGIAYTNTDGSLRDSTEVMLDVADRFATMKDGAEKSALAMDIFGKSGAEMVPFLNQGRDGISALTDQADRLGVTLSGDVADAAGQFNDNIDILKGAAQGLTNQIMAGMLPALNETADSLKDENSLLRDSVRVIGTATAAYAAVTIALNAKVIALRAATIAQTAFNAVAKANPYAIAAAGLGVLVAAIYNYNKATPEATRKTEEASTAMSRFDSITRRAADAIQMQNRAAAGMTMPQIKQKIDEVSASIGHLEILHKRASADFERGAVSAGLVSTYDAQLKQKREQLDHLNALLGEKNNAGTVATPKAATSTGISTTAAAPVAAPLGPTDEEILGWLEREGEAQAQVNSMREWYRQQDIQAEQVASEQRIMLAEAEAQARKSAMDGMFSNLISLMSSRSKTMFNIGKAAAITQTVLSTYEGAQKAYSALAGIPIVGPALGIAAAGAAIAAGAARVSAIRSQSFGGGGSVSNVGGGGGVASGGGFSGSTAGGGLVQQQAPRQQTTDIRLTGIRPDDMITGSYLMKIIEGIGETLADNGGRMGKVELVTA